MMLEDFYLYFYSLEGVVLMASYLIATTCLMEISRVIITAKFAVKSPSEMWYLVLPPSVYDREELCFESIYSLSPSLYFDQRDVFKN